MLALANWRRAATLFTRSNQQEDVVEPETRREDGALDEINRAGRGLSRSRRAKIERARRLMQAMVRARGTRVAAPGPAPGGPGRSGTRA